MSSSGKQPADALGSGSRSSAASHKRQATVRTDGSDKPDSRITIPITSWATALDFLPFEDVRTARLVNKAFAHEIPTHIETLSVFEASEMDIPFARRFPNVTELNLFSLIRCDGGQLVDNPRRPRKRVSQEALEGAALYLQAFPHLRYAFLGGREIVRFNAKLYNFREPYTPNVPYNPRNHLELYRTFMKSLCTAFKRRALSQDLQIKCVCTSDYARLCRGNCTLCTEICATLPFENAFWLDSKCILNTKRFEIISKRSGGKEYLQDPKQLLRLLENSSITTDSACFKDSMPDSVIQQVMKKNSTPREVATKCSVVHLQKSYVKKMKDLIACGNDPSKVHTKKFFKRLNEQRRRSLDFGEAAVAESLLDTLKTLGFQIQAGDVRLAVVREKDWPSLKEHLK